MIDVLSFWDVVLVFALVLVLAPSFGSYLARVYLNRPAFGDRILNPIENGIYRLLGVSPRSGMRAREYIAALLMVNGVVLVWVVLVLSWQQSVPGGTPVAVPMTWDLAFHTASSFVTNTDFLHYVPEVSVNEVAALLGLQVAMFLSAASGLSVAAAFIRGFVRRDGTIGNLYVDLVRSMTRVLFPLALLGGVVLVVLGVPQTLTNAVTAHPILGGSQPIVLGPVASWQSVDLVGSNGGGWYASNAASPLANPTPASSDFETALMLLLPFSLPFAFGEIVRRPAEGRPYLGTILAVFLIAVGVVAFFEGRGNPSAFAGIGHLSTNGAAGYPVGKEVRFSLGESVLFQVTSVYANVGATNMALGSITPVSQMVLLWGMFTQSTPGGVGTGFGTLLVNAVLAVFVAGLMVGRTPEYLGKKIGKTQIRWAAAILLVHPFLILVPLAGTILTGVTPVGGGTAAQHAHSFTIILYEFTSEAANNGSAMGPINDGSVPMNLIGAAIMLTARFVPMIGMLVIGATFAAEEILPAGPGTLRTRGAAFTIYLIGFLIIVTGLLFLPVIALGPLPQLGG